MDELVIKVPAPFSGIEDLGFTARHPAQDLTQRLRDVPFIIEGSARPMDRLVEYLTLFSEKEQLFPDADDEAYCWTPPVRLTDELCVLSFRDRSMRDPTLGSGDARGYFWNLLRPLAVTFLRDCVRIGGLRLTERIAVRLDPGRPPLVDLELQRTAIAPQNGTRLLFGS